VYNYDKKLGGVMTSSSRDLDSLFSFIDLASKSGYVNESTANNRKNAAKLVLTSVPNIDLSDVTKLDLDDIFQRFVTLSGSKLPPTTLQGKKSHLNSAIKEFTSYVADPVHYKPSLKTRKNRAVKVGVPIEEKPSPPISPEAAPDVSSRSENGIRPPSMPTLHTDFQIHIAPDTDPTLVEKIFESLSKYFPAK
jgi:hypothetical protein